MIVMPSMAWQENKETWTWFLQIIIDDLGHNSLSGVCIMSDQQKGLLPTVAELLPKVEQRFYVRHLYSNFRRKFPGQRLKELMWSATIATYLPEMQVEDDDAYKHLLQIPPRYWSKSRFSTDTKCDILLNNMSETFNSVILEQREKLFVTMVDDIQTHFMDRWAKNRKNVKSFY